MNDRPTPETDVCIIERRHIHKRDGSNQLLELIDAEFARKLERERDEAREALMEIEDRCVDCEDACDDIQKIRDIAAKALEGAK